MPVPVGVSKKKYERCVKAVRKKGLVDSPYAVCYASLSGCKGFSGCSSCSGCKGMGFYKSLWEPYLPEKTPVETWSDRVSAADEEILSIDPSVWNISNEAEEVKELVQGAIDETPLGVDKELIKWFLIAGMAAYLLRRK